MRDLTIFSKITSLDVAARGSLESAAKQGTADKLTNKTANNTLRITTTSFNFLASKKIKTRLQQKRLSHHAFGTFTRRLARPN
jgi:hypothetical protein